jgi:hypothetical protein
MCLILALITQPQELLKVLHVAGGEAPAVHAAVLTAPDVPAGTCTFAEHGIPAGALFACISAGTAASFISPFSTGGAMTIAGCPDAETQDKLSKQLIPAAIICPFIVVVLSMLSLMDWVQF